MSNKVLPPLSILVGVAFFLSAVYFAGTALRFWRVDLTEENLYTLSEGTHNILGQIEEPITLRLFYSEDLAPEVGMTNFGRRVRELLEEFEEAAQGKVVLQVISPEQFSEEEELATSLGVRGQMANAQGDLFFFGIAGTNSLDDLETIPTLRPDQESFLEYELAKLIHRLSTPELPQVAVLSSLPLQGGMGNPFGQSQPPWAIVEGLREHFEVEFVGPELTGPLSEDVDALLLVHPKDVSESTRYAIDQYALGGGKVCALVDPHCVFQPAPPNQRGPVDSASRLDDLLGTWGVELAPATVVGDLSMARLVPTRDNQLVRFPLFLELNAERDESVFDDEDVVTSALKLVTMLTAGELRPAEEATTTFTPLIRTSPGGRAIDAGQLQFAPDLLSLAPRLIQDFLLHAEGRIEFEGVPEDGATVTLSDGIRAPVTFEFTTDDTTAEENVAVDVSQAGDAAAAAQALRLQITVASMGISRTSGLDVEATGSGAVVELVTREPGPQGEIPIRRTGELAAEVTGMEIRGTPKVLAARVQGSIETAFPGGAPEGWEGSDQHLESSTADFNAIVVADADLVQDQLWQSRVSQGGFLMHRQNDNPTVLLNALENLCGSSDLLSLRSRGVVRRPFTKKEELDRKARERFQAKRDELAKKQQKLQQEIRELEQGADEQGVIRMSEQEFQELADKQQEYAETRKELGRVQNERDREIESLGRRVFLANLTLPTALVILFGIVFGLSTVGRRKSK